MDEMLIIGVPKADEDDLRGLAELLGQPAMISQQEYFDGGDIVELIVAGTQTVGASTAVWLTVRTWLLTRADRLKHTKVTIPGVGTLEGMSAKEMVRIIKLKEGLSGSDGPA